MDSPAAPEPNDTIDPAVHSRRWMILGVLCMSLLIIVLDNTILNVAIPRMMEDLSATNSQVQWMIDSYILVFAGLLLTFGSLSDRFGRKGALQIGLVIFMAGSAAAANAGSSTELIASRAFMGIGGALIMPSTLSILTNVFRNPSERARAIAIWAGFSGLGVAIGPLAGGLLLERFSWHSVFWINIPIGIVALVLGAILVPTSKDPNQGRFDPIGALLSIVGLTSLVYAIIEGPSLGWTTPEVLGGAGLAIVALVSFIWWENHTDSPMLDLTVFSNARFTAASLTITIVFFALFGSLFLMTQYWQFVHGYTPLQVGVRMLPYAAVMMVVAPSSARLVERFGTKRVVVAGLALVSTGLLLLSTIQADTAYPIVITYYCIMAAGMGMTMAPATESVMGSLPRAKAGVGSAINDTTRQVGGALGVAIIGSVYSTNYSSKMGQLAAQYQLPAQATGMAQDSLAGAYRAASQLGDGAAGFIAEANNRFVTSMATSMHLSAAIIIGAAIFAWRFLPARASDDQGLESTPSREPIEAESMSGAERAEIETISPVVTNPSADVA